MTKETFCRIVERILDPLPDMPKNSSVETVLHNLGRRVERSALDFDEAVTELERVFPLAINRQVKAELLKTLKRA